MNIMKPGFDVIETIKERCSVRTFEERPLPAPTRKAIADYASALTNPFGIDGISIAMTDKVCLNPGEKLGTYGIIKNAQTFLGLICPDSPDAVLAAGYEFEQLILFITSLGLGTVWLGATFSRKKFSRVMQIPADALFPAVSPVGYPAKRRLVEKVMRRFAKSDTRKPWNEIFFNGDFSTPLTLWEAGGFDNALEMVRLAPSATNTQPWRLLKIGDTFHFYVALKTKPSREELLFRRIDMGIALCHFDLSVQADGIKGSFTKSDPSIGNLPESYNYVISWKKEG